MKYKVGDIVTVKGKIYRVEEVKRVSCENCAGRSNYKTFFLFEQCFSDMRKDRTNVKFVEVSVD